MQFLTASLSLAAIAAALPSASSTPSKATAACKSVNTKMEWRELTAVQQVAYLKAVACLKTKKSVLNAGGAKTAWDDFEYVHSANAPNIHYTAQFLPWHRGFLALYDSALATQCSYTGPYPYYDWSADSQAPEASSIWHSDKFGGNGQFLTSYWNETVLTENVPSTTRVSRAWGSSGSAATDQLMATNYNPAQMALVLATKPFENFRQALENNPHGMFHDGVGGDMGVITTSVNDPIFFMHHRNVDRWYWMWQQKNPSLALTYVGNTVEGSNTNNAAASNAMNFWGLEQHYAGAGTAKFPISQALNPIGGGLNGLICIAYSVSVTPAQARTASNHKRDISHAHHGLRDHDRDDLRKIRYSTPLSDAFLQNNMYDQARIAIIRTSESQMNDFVDYINSVTSDLPGSLGHQRRGEDGGWRSKTQDEHDQEFAEYESYVAGYIAKYQPVSPYAQ